MILLTEFYSVLSANWDWDSVFSVLKINLHVVKCYQIFLQRKYLRIKTNLLLFRFFDSKESTKAGVICFNIFWSISTIEKNYIGILLDFFKYAFMSRIPVGFPTGIIIRIPLPSAAFTKFRSKLLSFCCILSSVIFCFSDQSSRWQWNSSRISVGIPIIILLKKPVGLFQKLKKILYLNKYGQSLVLSLIWLINCIIDHCTGLLWKRGSI